MSTRRIVAQSQRPTPNEEQPGNERPNSLPGMRALSARLIRIGTNIGDIIIDETDIYGDGSM